MHTRSSNSPPASEDPTSPREKAVWSTDDEEFLIQFLLERKGEMTSNAMFKETVFKEAGEALDKRLKKGAKKTALSCKTKWMRVCISFVFLAVS
jgi:hypothetical protein